MFFFFNFEYSEETICIYYTKMCVCFFFFLKNAFNENTLVLIRHTLKDANFLLGGNLFEKNI